MIVIELLDDCYSAVELFSYGKKGLAEKSHAAWDNHVSIQDHRHWEVDTDLFQQQGWHKHLRTEKLFGREELEKTTVAKLNKLVFRQYTFEVDEQSSLAPASFERLVKLVKERVLQFSGDSNVEVGKNLTRANGKPAATDAIVDRPRDLNDLVVGGPTALEAAVREAERARAKALAASHAKAHEAQVRALELQTLRDLLSKTSSLAPRALQETDHDVQARILDRVASGIQSPT